MSTTGMGAGTARVKLFMAVGLGRRIPVRVQAHPPDQHSLTWSYGDSCRVRALGGGSAVPPPPGQPRSVLHGVPGVSAPSLLSWLPVPLTSKSTARRQGPAHPHGHAQGHLAPYPPCSPSSTPACPSEPSHSSWVCRTILEARGEPDFGVRSGGSSSWWRTAGSWCVGRKGVDAPAISSACSCPTPAPSPPPWCSCPGGGPPSPPAYVGLTSVPTTLLLLHVPQCSQGSRPAQLPNTAWPPHYPVCRLCPFTHEGTRNANPQHVSQAHHLSAGALPSPLHCRVRASPWAHKSEAGLESLPS